jgi:hypothetical protein
MLPAQSTSEKAEKRSCLEHREDMPLLLPVEAVAKVSKIGNL